MRAAPVPAADPHAGVSMPSPGRSRSTRGSADANTRPTRPACRAGDGRSGRQGTAGRGRGPGVLEAGPGLLDAAGQLPRRGRRRGDGRHFTDRPGRRGRRSAGQRQPLARPRSGWSRSTRQGLAESSSKLTTPVGEAVVVDIEAVLGRRNPAKDGRIVAAHRAARPDDLVLQDARQRGVGRDREGGLPPLGRHRPQERDAEAAGTASRDAGRRQPTRNRPTCRRPPSRPRSRNRRTAPLAGPRGLAGNARQSRCGWPPSAVGERWRSR